MKSIFTAAALALSISTAYAQTACDKFMDGASPATKAIIEAVNAQATAEHGSVDAAAGSIAGMVQSQTRSVASTQRTLANSATEWREAAVQAGEYYKLRAAGCQ
jgi:hypothetical protein